MRSRFSRCTLAMLALVVVFSFPALACSFLQPALPKLDSSSNETDMVAAVNATLTAAAETEAALATPTPPPSPTLPAQPTSTDTPEPTIPPTETQIPTPTGTWIGAITFAPGIDSENRPIDPGTVFKRGVTHMYAFFPYSGIEEGKKITYYWTVNGKEFVSAVDTWQWDSSGTFVTSTAYSNNRQLDSGNWILTIFIDNKKLASGTFKILP
jgi:hypothetical protein